MGSPRSAWPALVAAGVLAGCSAAVLAQSPSNEEALRQRVEELEAKLKRLEEKLEQAVTGAPAAAPQAPSPVQPVTAPQEPAPRDPALQQRVDELDQQVKVLARKQELEQEDEAAARKSQPTVSVGSNGVNIRSADGQNSFTLKATLQNDGRFFIGDQPNDTDTFLIRSMRMIFDGTFAGVYDFRFSPDFAGSRTVIQDVYLHARFQPYAQLRVGKFKEPVGLERLQSEPDVRWAERAFPTNILPNRDIGVMLAGDLLESRLEYQVGYFNGVTDGRSSEDFTNDQDNNTDKSWAARVFTQPFRSSPGPFQGLGLGVAGTYSDALGRSGTTSQDTNLPTYRTIAQQTMFTYRTGATNGAFGSGEQIRLTPQAFWYWNSLGVLAEYARNTQDVQRNVTATNIRRDKVDVTAWQVYATYLVTGEDNTFRGIKPKNPFAFGSSGWGALELGLRYTAFNVSDSAFAGGNASFADPAVSVKSAKAWGAVMNWYLTNNVRFMLDYERTRFQWGGGAQGGVPLDRPDEELVFGRVQFAF
jgi:phosphate-selective porin OprO/OprP